MPRSGNYDFIRKWVDVPAAACRSNDLSLLAAVSNDLTSHGISHAVVGGMALAAHGIARATLDTDLLIVMAEPPNPDVWVRAKAMGAQVETRLGDAEDPFRAVVRITHPTAGPVDVLVGKSQWQRDIIARAQPVFLLDSNVPVVSAADLVLLKLFAGGPQDLWDIQRLLTTSSRAAFIAEVDSRVVALPPTCRTRWDELKKPSP